ncbi:MAG: hypothetical protein ABJA86_14180 [Nocardioidaceae bacterium]
MTTLSGPSAAAGSQQMMMHIDFEVVDLDAAVGVHAKYVFRTQPAAEVRVTHRNA